MKHLRDQLPVPALSDISRRRIRDGVFAALDREAPTVVDPRPLGASQAARPRRRRWAPALAIAGAMAVAAGALLVWSLADRGQPGLAVEPSRVVTGAASSELTLGPAALEVAARSAVVVSGDDSRGYLAVLERGGLSGTIDARAAAGPFRVQAGDVRVEVLRSRFAIYRHGDAARVRVDSGVVRVTYRGELLSVAAGQTWAPDGADVAGDADGQTQAPDGGASGQGDRASSPGDGAGRMTAAPERPTAKHRRSRRARRSRGARDHHADAEAAAIDAPEAIHAGDVGAPNAPAATGPTDKERYEEAARLEASRPRDAIAIYRELAARPGPWAANALFAHGRLEWERGSRGAAERLLRSYLRRYPRGNNARVARKLLGEAE